MDKVILIRTFLPDRVLRTWCLYQRQIIPLNASKIKDSINYIVARINRENPEQYFEHLTPHGLRHTFATNCIERGMAPKTLQKILGHNSLQMTMDLYCHVREETLRKEMSKIGEMVY